MKFGYPFWYGDGSIRKHAEIARKLGFDYVEFSLNYPWPEKLSESEKMFLMNLKRNYNLDIAFHAPLGGVDLCYPRKDIYEASMKVFSDSMEFAADFASLYFNFHLATDVPTWKCADIRKEFVESARHSVSQIAKTADSYDIQLTLENNPKKMFSDIKELKPFLHDNLKFCFDVGHAARAAGEKSEKIFDWIKAFRKDMLVLHLHDVSSETDHLSLGEGNLPLEKILESVKRTKCNYTLIELHRGANGRDVVERDFKNGLNYSKKFL
ncbi:MAG: sugar phosphate isomerase/epimerase family protein [Candidatus Aenigmatarchaeota archaeon]